MKKAKTEQDYADERPRAAPRTTAIAASAQHNPQGGIMYRPV